MEQSKTKSISTSAGDLTPKKPLQPRRQPVSQLRGEIPSVHTNEEQIKTADSNSSTVSAATPGKRKPSQLGGSIPSLSALARLGGGGAAGGIAFAVEEEDEENGDRDDSCAPHSTTTATTTTRTAATTTTTGTAAMNLSMRTKNPPDIPAASTDNSISPTSQSTEGTSESSSDDNLSPLAPTRTEEFPAGFALRKRRTSLSQPQLAMSSRMPVDDVGAELLAPSPLGGLPAPVTDARDQQRQHASMAVLAASEVDDAIPDFLKPEYVLPARKPSRVEAFALAVAAANSSTPVPIFGKTPIRRAALIQPFAQFTGVVDGTDPNLAASDIKTSGSAIPKEKLAEERSAGIWGAALFKTFISNKLGKLSGDEATGDKSKEERTAKALAEQEKRYDYSDYVLPVGKPDLDEALDFSEDSDLDYYLPLGHYHVKYLPTPLETVVLKYPTLPQKVETKQATVVPSFIIQGSDEFEMLRASGELVDHQETVDSSNNQAFYTTSSIKIHLTPSRAGSQMSLQIPQSVSGSISSDKSSSMSDLSLDHESISQKSETSDNEEKEDGEEKDDKEKKDAKEEKDDKEDNKVSASSDNAPAVGVATTDDTTGNLPADVVPSPVQPLKEYEPSSPILSPSAIRGALSSHAAGKSSPDHGSFSNLAPCVTLYGSSSRLQDSPKHVSTSTDQVSRNLSPAGSMNWTDEVPADGGTIRRNRVNGSNVSLRNNDHGSKSSLRSNPQLNIASSKASLTGNAHLNVADSKGSLSGNQTIGSKGSLLGAESKTSLRSTQSRLSMRNVHLPKPVQLNQDQQVSMRNLGVKNPENSSVRSLNESALPMHLKSKAAHSGSHGALAGRASPSATRPQGSQSLDRQGNVLQANQSPMRLGITVVESRSLRTVYKGGQEKKLALQSGGSLNYQAVRNTKVTPGDGSNGSPSGSDSRNRGAVQTLGRDIPVRKSPDMGRKDVLGSPRQYRGKEVSGRFKEFTPAGSEPSTQNSPDQKEGTQQKQISDSNADKIDT